MKTWTPVLFSLLLCLGAQAQQPLAQEELLEQGNRLYQQKSYAESAALYAQAAPLPGTLKATAYYNAACSFALAGQADNAMEQLLLALKAGFYNEAHLQKDTDLEILHQHPQWQQALQACATNKQVNEMLYGDKAFSTPYEPALSEDQKIAGLSRFWMEVKHNFAYFHQVPNLQWDSLYLAYLPRVRATATTQEYYLLLAEMCAKLQDAHTNVYPPRELSNTFYSRPALKTKLIEDRVLITELLDPALAQKGLYVGQEVVQVNGLPVQEYAETKIAPYQSCSTPQDRQVRLYQYALLNGSDAEPVQLLVKDKKGKEFTVSLAREFGKPRQQQPAFVYKKLPGGYAHIMLNSFEVDTAIAAFAQLLPELQQSKGIIFDVRENGGGNGGVGYALLRYLIKEQVHISQWSTRNYLPAFRAWQRPMPAYVQDEYLFPEEVLLHQPVVVLTSGKTFSAAEDFTVAFQATKRGAVIGEPTGGSTGQPLSFKLPGGLTARVCSKRDTYPDGTDFVGVGIQPDVVVKPTVAAFRKGKDETLEAALAYLKKQLPH